MLNATQWVNPPGLPASGSCTIIASDLVWGGSSPRWSAGLTLAPSQVNLAGIMVLAPKAGLLTVKVAYIKRLIIVNIAMFSHFDAKHIPSTHPLFSFQHSNRKSRGNYP